MFFPGNDPTRAGLGDTVTLGEIYSDTLWALDPDKDSLVYSLLDAPQGANLTNNSIQWIPDENDLGPNDFAALVTDGRGGSDTLAWQVSTGDTNHPPQFLPLTTSNTSHLAVGSQYSDTVRALDKDHDLLSFSLDYGPAGLTLSDTIISWTASITDTGSHEVRIAVSDNRGGADSLSWNLTVADTNHWALFCPDTIPVADSIAVGSKYSREMPGCDADSDRLYYSFLEAPTGIHQELFEISWTPEVSDTGTHAITFLVTDSIGPTDTSHWTITVTDTNHTPTFSSPSGLRDTTIRVGRTYRDTAHATDGDADSLSFLLQDDGHNATVQDSIVSWIPNESDRGNRDFVMSVADSSGHGDTTRWTITVIDTNHPPQFITTPDSIADTLFSGDLYHAILRTLDPDSESIAISLLVNLDSLSLSGDSIRWRVNTSDVGTTDLAAVVTDSSGASDTLRWQVIVMGQPRECPPYTHLYDAPTGDPSTLDQGYFVFTLKERYGLYKSHIRTYKPVLIPNTQAEQIINPGISDNGEWLLYVDKRQYSTWLIRQDGTHKTLVPVQATLYGHPRSVGFLRSSPYGEEVYYSCNSTTLRAVRTQFLADTVYFGADRPLVDLSSSSLTWSIVADPLIDISVVRDQVMARFENWVTGSRCTRTEFLTIPNNGMGIGTAQDIYAWKDDDYVSIDGCGHTMSHDGAYALQNVPYYIGYSAPCVPAEHRGVAITPFRRAGDPPIDLYHEHYEKYGISLNWCPAPYRSDADFWGWYFTNNNRFVVGRHYLPDSPANGVWLLEWPTNTWTRLTPSDTPLDIVEPALYFGAEGFGAGDTTLVDTTGPTVDPFDPRYRVVSPNGGEILYVGDPCTVTVSSVLDGNAALSIEIDSGLIEFRLPGLTSAINPRSDSVIVFYVPDSVPVYSYDPGRGYAIPKMESTLSEFCKLHIADYQAPTDYTDFSDGFFAIRKRE